MDSREILVLILVLINVHSQLIPDNQNQKNNIDLAFHGVDVALKNPFSLKHADDPSIKGQIFVPIETTKRGDTKVKHFFSVIERLTCDTEFSEEVYKNYDEYSSEKLMSSISKISLGFDNNDK
jgi:hypothetical protein